MASNRIGSRKTIPLSDNT